MNALLAKILFKDPIVNLRDHMTAAQKEAAALEKYRNVAFNHPATIEAAWITFTKRPTDENYRSLLALETQRTAAFGISQSLAGRVSERVKGAITDGGEAKLLDAIAAVEKALDERERLTKAEDTLRSGESGVAIVSEAIFKAIDGLREQLTNARQYRRHDLRSSIGTVLSIAD